MRYISRYSAKPIHATAIAGLLGLDLEPELLFQSPGNGSACRVRLPAERLGDLDDGCATRLLEHGDQLACLLSVRGVLPCLVAAFGLAAPLVRAAFLLVACWRLKLST
jgi:hypothetical protein